MICVICFFSCRNATTSFSSDTVWNTTRSPPTGWLLAQLLSSRYCHSLALWPSSEVCVQTGTSVRLDNKCDHSGLTKKFLFSLSTAYHAPLDLYPEFHTIAKDPTLHSVPEGRAVSVCVGKEWYRFPSSFLLPHKSVFMISTQVFSV